MDVLNLRVIEWNKERGLLDDFDPSLEIRLLSEEASEFLKADSFSHMLQEYADFQFVKVGTIAKYFSKKYSTFNTFELGESRWNKLIAWIEDTQEYLHSLLLSGTPPAIDKYQLQEYIEVAYAIVITENEKKSNKKINGKIVKGSDHVDPIIAIKAYVEGRLTK